MEAIKNVIFDLGGVLLHLDLGRTEAAFRALMGSDEAYLKASKVLNDKGVFESLETNGIHETDFVKALQKENPNAVTKDQIEMAWNAMLLTFPAQGLHLVEALKAAGYRVYVLSNTNSIHLRAFRKILEKEHGITDFDSLFEKAYYSHLIEERKPNRRAFEYVLKDANLVAQETLFIDDNAPNLVEARALGIHTLLHPANTAIERHVKTYLNM